MAAGTVSLLAAMLSSDQPAIQEKAAAMLLRLAFKLQQNEDAITATIAQVKAASCARASSCSALQA